MDSDINDIFKKLSGGFNVRINFDLRLPRNLFEKIVQRFIYQEENGGLGYKYAMKSDLKIVVPTSDFFIEIDNKNDVKKYWQFFELPQYCYKLEKIVQHHRIERYGIDIQLIDKMDKEHDKDVEKAMTGEAAKEYIYRNYYEVEDPKFKFKTNLIEERRSHSSKSFKESGCLTVTPTYYLNLTFEEITPGEEFDKYFSIYLRWILEEIQQSNFIITIDEKESLLASFKRITKQNDFILADPVEVLRRNFHRNDKFPYVRDDYALAYQPHGELRFLYIAENFSKNVDGKIFMITKDFNVINTGRIVEGFENSLLEGYFNETNNLFYITDILFYKGRDVRVNKFHNMGAGAKDKFRFDYLMQFYREGVQKSKYLDPELRDESTKIIVARYLFGNGPSFEENVNELFDRVKLQDFMISGIMFRPVNDPYPMKGGFWYSLFKWTYPPFKTIDFLVKYVLDGKNPRLSPFQLPSKGKYLFGKIIHYKTLELKVGGYKDIPGENELSQKKIFTVTNFTPIGVDPRLDVNLANIPLNDAGDVVAHDELTDIYEKIDDNTVVEFAYQKIYGEFTTLFKWTPMRINHLKTKQIREGNYSSITTEHYANHMWNAFTNNITETHLREGTVPEEDISKSYYANNALRLKKFPFQIFHNRIVKDNLIMNVCPAIINHSKTMIGSLLDLACGSGGDFAKWKLGLLKKIVGIDYAKDNIETAMNIYKKARRPKPDVTYIWGNAGRLIFPDYDAGMDYQSRDLLKKTILSKNQYDVVSVQFAIHYMFEDEIMIRTLLQNVTDNLKIGGYFIGTSLDGERVFDMLKDKNKEIGMVGDDLLWRIDKEYSLKKWDRKKANLGEKIEVFVSTIGIPHKEYLVNYDYLKELAKEYGLEVVSVRSFGEIYDEAIAKKTEWDEDLKNMSGGEKMFSFLHNEFTFLKKKDASDQTYKRLMQLIAKKVKKEERMSQFNNNRIKIKVKSGGKPIVRKNNDESSQESESEKKDVEAVGENSSETTESSIKSIIVPDELTDSSIKSITIPD